MAADRKRDSEFDFALAAQLQRALLPRNFPVSGDRHKTAARNRMCGHVGGDFYDFVRINRDQLAIVVGDVVGHGVRASLVMAQIMGFFRSDRNIRIRPAKAIDELNEMLIELGERIGDIVPCSIFYALLDEPSGLLLFVNAGHPRPFLCTAESCANTQIGPRNMLLGVDPFLPEEGCHTLSPGERLVLYTDGVTDAFNPNDEPFGRNRLLETLHANSSVSPDQCADAVFDAIDAFRDGAPQTDDETILIMDRV